MCSFFHLINVLEDIQYFSSTCLDVAGLWQYSSIICCLNSGEYVSLAHPIENCFVQSPHFRLCPHDASLPFFEIFEESQWRQSIVVDVFHIIYTVQLKLNLHYSKIPYSLKSKTLLHLFYIWVSLSYLDCIFEAWKFLEIHQHVLHWSLLYF